MLTIVFAEQKGHTLPSGQRRSHFRKLEEQPRPRPERDLCQRRCVLRAARAPLAQEQEADRPGVVNVS